MDRREVTVALVLDLHFGTKLRSVAERFDVWIVASPENRAAIEPLWQECRDGRLQHQLTIWSKLFDLSSEESWRGMLTSIEMHHEPMAILEILGPELSEAGRSVLAEFNYTPIERTPQGWRARRQP